jgi:hypothetical protein
MLRTQRSLSDTLNHTNTLASLQLEIPPAPALLYFNNRETDDLPPSIVGNAIWENIPYSPTTKLLASIH